MSTDSAAAALAALDRLEAVIVRNEELFAEGYRLGYEAGYDHGELQGARQEAWGNHAALRDVRRRPEGGWQRRLAAAEAHNRALALRQWSNPKAWESVMNAAPGLAVAIAGLAGRP